MFIFEKIKNFFITFIQFIITGTAFFIFSILALITSWIIFLVFSVMTILGTI